MVHFAGPVRNKTAEFIKQEWQSVLGIQCTVEPLPWRIFFPRMTEGDFLIGGMSWHPWVNDPIYTLDSFKNRKEPINFAKWENSDYQKALNCAIKETNTKTKYEHYLQAEKILVEEMPVIPINIVVSGAIKKKNMQRTHPSTIMNFKWTYFSPPCPKE